MPPATEGVWRVPQSVPFKAKDLFDRGNKHKINDTRGLFVIHAVHLHTGKVLWFCGHTEDLLYPQASYVFDPRKPGDPPKEAKIPAGLDLFCCHYVQIPDGKILVVGGSQIDRHHATSFNRNRDYRGSRGASTIATFDPKTEKWAKVGSLLQGRWYPTAVLLGDGSVVVISGRREDVELTWTIPQAEELLRNHLIADKVEHLRAPDYGKPVNVAGAEKAIPIYPGIHLAPDDRLWTTHTNWGQEIPEPNTLALTVVPPPAGSPKGAAATGVWTEFTLAGHKARQPEREEGMSVMLPVLMDPATKRPRPDTLGKFLVIGGGFAVDHEGISPVQIADRGPAPTFSFLTRPGLGTMSFDRQQIAHPEPAEILDVTPSHGPVWTKAPGTLRHPRINGHCVLLPDATVAVLGGHDNYKWHASTNTAQADAPPAAPVPAPPPPPPPPVPPPAAPAPIKKVPVTKPTLEVELFTPGVGFTVGAKMAHPRMYHSIAMLLVDGTVLVAGGADPNEHEPPLHYPDTWQGRTYLSTVRRLQGSAAGATSVAIDLGPSPVVNGLPFPELPVGTLLIIDPGKPLEFVTEFVAQRLVLGPGGGFFVDLKDPLPNDFPPGTRIEFETAGVASPVPRKNEWLTVPPRSMNSRTALSQPLNRKDYEIYEPPYVHKPGVRPVLRPIKPGKVQVAYGATFTIATDDADRITRVAIMRPGCVTHHTDTEQRFVELPFTKVDSKTLSATMVPATDSSLAPPGYYMLWILAGDLPCVEARFIQLTGAPALRTVAAPVEAPPPPTPVTPPTTGLGPDDDRICPLAAATGAVAPIALVAFLAASADLGSLRAVRDELRQGRTGSWFVRALGVPYYRAGRPVGQYVTRHPTAALTVCRTVMAPTAAAVRRASDASRGPDGTLRPGRLLPVLGVVGVGALALSAVGAAAETIRRAVGWRRSRLPAAAPHRGGVDD